jgi:Fur family ferric uptake transcriptional regulator
MRNTRQRAAVSDALERDDRFRSAQELHDELRGEGHKIGLATVYRTLQSLTSAGEVDAVRREDGEAIYRRCTTRRHHHHLVCRGCGYSIEVDNDEVERWADAAARRNGFSNVSHDLEIFGDCARCAPAPVPRDRPSRRDRPRRSR